LYKPQIDDYRAIVLYYLDKNGTVNKSRLIEVITSPPILTQVLKAMEEEGLVTVTEKRIGRKRIEVSITERGDTVVEQLKKAEAAAKGMKFTFPDKFGIITLLDASEKLTMDEIADTYPDPASTLRELESLKLIKQTIDTSQYPMQNYFSLTEKGKKVAVKLKEIDEIIKA
jgi:DNA-binding HxlR family transcriptional regulator